MEDQTALWEIVVTWGLLLFVFGGAVVASLWARRRRRLSETYDNAEGAEALLGDPGHWGG